jgi:glycosyltransferase involved in cell wall biosynthesis
MLTRYTDLLLFQNQEDLTESLRHGIQARWGNLKIGNGIHLGQLVRMDRQEQDPPVVLTIGRLEPVKNQAFLLRAARRAADRGARFQLWFAGAGPLLESHRRLAASLGLADRSRFFGYVSNVPDLIRQASLAVLPSIKEGIPRGLLEPMAAGVPVVASDVKGNRETVCHGKTGWLVPLDDDEALAQTLHIALADRELRQRMGVAAAQSIRENFDEDRVVDRLMDVYESLVARSGVAVR